MKLPLILGHMNSRWVLKFLMPNKLLVRVPALPEVELENIALARVG